MAHYKRNRRARTTKRETHREEGKIIRRRAERIARLMERDGIDYEEAERQLAARAYAAALPKMIRWTNHGP